MNELDVDIKLLVALDAILDEQNVTRAAKRVGLSQPAMSNALARLRKLLGDPLLVRTSKGMAITTRAQEIAGPVREAIANVRSALRPRDVFNAAVSTDRFTVASTDYAEMLFLPALMTKLRVEAPLANLAIHPLVACDGYKDLANGLIDVMLGFSTEVPEGLYRQILLNDRFVCILAAGHPDAHRPLTLERYVALSHVLVSPRGESSGVVDDVIGQGGKKRRVALTLPHFALAPVVVSQSDCIATLPERFVRHASRRLPIVVLDPPIPLPTFSLTQIWHERTHQSGAHRWFRQVLASAFEA